MNIIAFSSDIPLSRTCVLSQYGSVILLLVSLATCILSSPTQYMELEEFIDHTVDDTAHEDPPMDIPAGIIIADLTKVYNQWVSTTFMSIY